jgi:cellulose synthase/poly-beta-1,6-N-acetylglucosamine synthase-like glycosyltransferase
MVMFSISATSRYVFWRIAYTINTDSTTDLIFALMLVGAEIYAWIVLLLGYLQTAWPLKRKPVILPEDTSTWPTVDLFIPSYNEDLAVVKPTVLAALGIDWPRDKLNIVILDDGRRPEFAAFAKEVECSVLPVRITTMLKPVILMQHSREQRANSLLSLIATICRRAHSCSTRWGGSLWIQSWP